MRAQPTSLPGVVVVELDQHADPRGHLVEVYHRDKHAALGVAVGVTFVQDNVARSHGGVVRGLHFQRSLPQGKLVAAVRGAIFDVVVDVRRGSPTFGQWFGTILSADDRRQLWTPPGYAHGYQAMSEVADVLYKLTAPYTPGDERAIRWDDPAIGIVWPRPDVTVSPRDAAAPLLADADVPEYAP